MSYTADNTSFLRDLERVVRVRHQAATHLSQIAKLLGQAELEAEETSGKLSLEREREDIQSASDNLQKGLFIDLFVAFVGPE